jgi:FkbM family methyltransferase
LNRVKTHPGTLQNQPSGLTHALYYWLTRVPSLYLFLERYRRRGNWDKRIYLCFIRPGDIVLDVGANFGGHTVIFSHLVGKEGHVIAFEPVPETFAALQENVEHRSRHSNVSTFPAAVGNPRSSNDSVLIRVPGDDFYQASLAIQTAGSWAHSPDVREYSVPLRSLDADDTVQRLPRLDFVKVDVEGGELDVLKGAAKTLSRHGPLLYCEVYENWASSFGYTPADLLTFGRSLGYTDARVITKGRVYSLGLDQPIPHGWFDTSSDVLFLTPEHSRLAARFDRLFLRP